MRLFRLETRRQLAVCPMAELLIDSGIDGLIEVANAAVSQSEHRSAVMRRPKAPHETGAPQAGNYGLARAHLGRLDALDGRAWLGRRFARFQARHTQRIEPQCGRNDRAIVGRSRHSTGQSAVPLRELVNGRARVAQ